MRFVIGGAYQGKLDYVKRTFEAAAETVADGETCTAEDLKTAGVLNHFHLLVKRLVQEGQDPYQALEWIRQGNPQLVVISNEVGYGVVPMEAFDRKYREAVGRVSCVLAKEAGEVHRVVCGLGQVIKACPDTQV